MRPPLVRSHAREFPRGRAPMFDSHRPPLPSFPPLRPALRTVLLLPPPPMYHPSPSRRLPGPCLPHPPPRPVLRRASPPVSFPSPTRLALARRDGARRASGAVRRESGLGGCDDGDRKGTGCKSGVGGRREAGGGG